MEMVANGHTNGDYHRFLASKSQVGEQAGFEPLWLPSFLYPFQEYLCAWAIRKGRAAIFADTGMGKTPMFLVWAENVVRHTNKSVLVITTLGDSAQTVWEAEKFGVDAIRCRDGRFAGTRIVVTNYERLHHFNPGGFSGAVCNESSAIKDFESKRQKDVIEFLRTIPHRLLCTATPPPNDYVELGTSAEALGELGRMDMLARFFKNDGGTLHLLGTKHGDFTRDKWRFKHHAERPFWRWVCSWARACRKPSDLDPSFDDNPFTLPPLIVRETVVKAERPRGGLLFDMPAETLADQREERRLTMDRRCEEVARLVGEHDGHSLAWCHLNPEGDLIERLIPGSVQIAGSDPDEKKEEAIEWFVGRNHRGNPGKRVLVSKPVILGLGLNLQHCNHMTFFPSHSYLQWRQGIGRCQRFGQMLTVTVDVVTSEGERGVLANLRRKAEQADRMFEALVNEMNNEMKIGRSADFPTPVELPRWL
jgi:hypothetical protein